MRPRGPGPPTRSTIVCGVDHSAESRRALRVAAGFAERLGSRLVLVTVRRSAADLPAGMASEAEIARERSVEHGRHLLADAGSAVLPRPYSHRTSHAVDCVEGRVEFGEPAAGLAGAAEDLDASLIVVGSRGRGRANALLMGSVSASLAAAPTRPVLVVPPKTPPRPPVAGAAGTPPASIVCGVDGSDHAEQAVRVAGELATLLGVRLVLSHVERDGEELPAAAIDFAARLRRETRSRLRLLQRVVKAAGNCNVEFRLVRGDPAASLAQLATRESAEMIAVGTRGHGALKAFALGSVSRTLGASGPRPVLIASRRC